MSLKKELISLLEDMSELMELKGENKFIYSPYDTSFFSGNYYDTPKEILKSSKAIELYFGNQYNY